MHKLLTSSSGYKAMKSNHLRLSKRVRQRGQTDEPQFYKESTWHITLKYSKARSGEKNQHFHSKNEAQELITPTSQHVNQVCTCLACVLGSLNWCQLCIMNFVSSQDQACHPAVWSDTNTDAQNESKVSDCKQEADLKVYMMMILRLYHNAVSRRAEQQLWV